MAQVLPGPAIGGSAAAFEQVLGGPNDASIGAQLHYQRCAGTDVDQFVVLAPNDQVWTIQRAWCDLASVPADQRFADAARFLPPDARRPGRRSRPSRASRVDVPERQPGGGATGGPVSRLRG